MVVVNGKRRLPFQPNVEYKREKDDGYDLIVLKAPSEEYSEKKLLCPMIDTRISTEFEDKRQEIMHNGRLVRTMDTRKVVILYTSPCRTGSM